MTELLPVASAAPDWPGPAPPDQVPGLDQVMAKAGRENFPVASRALPRSVRAHLLAIYGFARLADDLGDEGEGDRLARLDWLESELGRACRGQATHPVLARLTPTLSSLGLPEEPFRQLIQANRQDQVVLRYDTFGELLGYCRLSANPVGRLVLAVFGLATPERVALSDRVCTGLQLAEHCQDVAEDVARGRVYLPAEDRDRFGVSEDDLGRPHATPALAALMTFQVARARSFLDAGAALAAGLPPGARLAVAGFTGGGMAALDAIERAGFDVLAGAPRPARARVAIRTAGVILGGGRR